MHNFSFKAVPIEVKSFDELFEPQRAGAVYPLSSLRVGPTGHAYTRKCVRKFRTCTDAGLYDSEFFGEVALISIGFNAARFPLALH